jgi:hypothetical protein
MTNSYPLRAVAIVFAAAILACNGCQALAPSGAKNWFGWSSPKAKESEYVTPVRMAAVWTPAVLNQAGQQPTRGLGGRLYFYDAANRPVPVEGQLVVYAYNDSKPGADGKTPDAKYAFTPEQFTTHYTPSDLGASYSIWIPWDQVGQPRMEVTLVPIFTASSGQLVMGQSSRNLLAGPAAPLNYPQPVQHGELPPPEIRRDYGVQAASFQQQPGAAAKPAATGVEALSLRLPNSLAERLAQAGPQLSPNSRAAMPAAVGNTTATVPQFAPPQSTLPASTATEQRPAGPGAVPPPWFPWNPPPIRSELPKLPAPVALGLPRVDGPLPTQLFPAGSPSAPPALR